MKKTISSRTILAIVCLACMAIMDTIVCYVWGQQPNSLTSLIAGFAWYDILIAAVWVTIDSILKNR